MAESNSHPGRRHHRAPLGRTATAAWVTCGRRRVRPTRSLPRTPGRPLPPPGGRSPGGGSGGGVAATRRRTTLTQRTARASLGTHRAQRARGPGQRVRPVSAVRASAGATLERPYMTPSVGAAAGEGRHADSASSFGAQSPAGGQRGLGASQLRATSASGAHSPGRHVDPRGNSPQKNSRRGPLGGGRQPGWQVSLQGPLGTAPGPLGTGSPAEPEMGAALSSDIKVTGASRRCRTRGARTPKCLNARLVRRAETPAWASVTRGASVHGLPAPAAG